MKLTTFPFKVMWIDLPFDINIIFFIVSTPFEFYVISHAKFILILYFIFIIDVSWNNKNSTEYRYHRIPFDETHSITCLFYIWIINSFNRNTFAKSGKLFGKLFLVLNWSPPCNRMLNKYNVYRYRYMLHIAFS